MRKARKMKGKYKERKKERKKRNTVRGANEKIYSIRNISIYAEKERKNGRRDLENVV
jgi:hypothetical protein